MWNNKKMSRASLAMAGLVVMFIFIWFLTSDDEKKQEAKVSQTEENKLAMGRGDEDIIFPVRFEEFNQQDYQENLNYRGRTRAKWKADVTTEADGKVDKLYFSEWDFVKKGKLLAKIDGGDIDTQIRLANTDIRVKQEEYEAEKKLAAKGVSGELSALRAELSLTQSESNLESLRIRKDKLELKSPFSGTVVKRNVVEGEFVGKGRAIAKIVALDPMLADVYVTDKIRRRLSTGMKVMVDFGEGLSREGRVSNVATESDSITKTYAIEISLANSDKALVEGMAASVDFELGSMNAHFIQAANIVLNDDEELGVMVVDEQADQDKAKFVKVSLISDTQEGIWVGGLEGSVKIITDGNYYVKDGDKISVE